ncbi:ABC transporter ATP-binding protein [Bacillus sp. APMAM]|nr:ABC transporter ATP-binding protein [Bacillus sp. APMAM]RTZ55182.1 ABC transporter ATP-binding protein [Bacillus sp. SAJ1]
MRIELHNVNKTYHTGVESIHVLKNINLTIESGKWLTITGASGSGKTTLLRCLSAIEQVDSGEIILGDLNAKTALEEEKRKYRRNNIGYIFQDFQLFEQFDVLTNVMIPKLPDGAQKEAEKKAKQLLEIVGLSGRQQHMPSQISGGEKQRTAIARALMNDPQLILCDEPTGNLDVDNRDMIMDILKEIHQNGVSVVLVTHDKELAKYGDFQCELRNGQILDKLIAVI